LISCHTGHNDATQSLLASAANTLRALCRERVNEHYRRGQGSLVSGTGWLLGNQALALALQTASFLLLAQALGVTEFGRLAAIAALITIATPIATWGYEGILFRRAAREPEATPQALGQAVVAALLAGTATAIGLTILSSALLPATLPPSVIAALCVAELVFGRISFLFGVAFRVTERYSATLVCTLIAQTLRLLAALALYYSGPAANAATWAAFTLLLSLASVLVPLVLYFRAGSGIILSIKGLSTGITEGGYFTLSGLSRTICAHADKALLARESSASIMGPYAAASRLIDVAMQPLLALAAASYGRFFRSGSTGIGSSHELALRLLPFSIGYGALAGVSLVLLAPYAAPLLGPGFETVAEMAIWLAPLPLLRGLQYQAGGALTGAGHQHRRALLQLASAAFSVVLCIVLIPRFSWRGAASAAVLTDLLLSATLWFMLISLYRRGRADPGLGQTKLTSDDC
jgi:O-antigen/teichoic acid export membrane protein